MASKFGSTAASDDLRRLCECPVCFEPYKDPRLLKCGHQFCEKCLSGIIDQSPHQKICCPVCRDVTKPQNGDVKTLPRATLLQHMQDLIFRQPAQEALGQKCTKCNTRKPTRHCPECIAELSYLCDQCFAVHQKVKRFAAHSTVKFDPNLICPDHPLKQVENFCHTCDKATCVDCLFDDHGDHKTEPLDDLAEKQRQKLKDFLAKSSAETKYTINYSKIDNTKKEINADKEKQKLAVKNARSALKKLDSVLEKAENDMNSHFNAALDEIDSYKTKAVETFNIGDKTLKLAKSLLGDDVSDPQVIIGSRDLHDLPDIGQIEITVPDVGDTISKMAADLQNMASRINIKQKKEVIDARAAAEVGREEWKLEHVRDIKVSGYTQGICFNRKDKTFVIRDSDEQHQIKVYNTAGKLQKQLGAGSLSLPSSITWANTSSIAIDTKQDLYLLPNDNGTLVRMEMDGRVKDTTKLGNNLCGVCYIPGHDQYALTDYKDDRKSSVFLVSADSLTVTRTLNDKLHSPSHVCTGEIHGTRTVVVSDWGVNIIYLYNMEGKQIKTYGPHTDIGNLDHPSGVSVDRYGRIIVCNYWNSRVLCVGSDKDGDHWECLLDKEQLGGEHPWCLDVDNESRFMAVGLDYISCGDRNVKLYQF